MFWEMIHFSIRIHYASHASKEQQSRKTLLYHTALVFAMVGSSYAAVPLYRRFCQATGYGGTVQLREVNLCFMLLFSYLFTVSDFFSSVLFSTGAIFFLRSVEEKIARHTKDGTVATREIVVQFNANVADGLPWKFVPTQKEVRVKPGESSLAFYTAENRSSTPITGVSSYNVALMKVFFYVDPEFETDPRMDGINNLILSYTFFKVSEE